MSKPFKDITCQRFGRLTALYRLHNYHKKGTYWLCICDCGRLTEVTTQNIKKVKSCIKCRNPSNIKHKHSNDRIYKIYLGMKKRCYNHNEKAYHNYGERGITICDEWLHDFQKFYVWSMENGYNDNLTIDRIDVNKGYDPNNCRWTDMYTQNTNTRRELFGIVLHEYNSLEYFSLKYNIPRRLVRQRFVKYGWTFEDSVLTPICKDRSYKRYSQHEHN